MSRTAARHLKTAVRCERSAHFHSRVVKDEDTSPSEKEQQRKNEVMNPTAVSHLILNKLQSGF